MQANLKVCANMTESKRKLLVMLCFEMGPIQNNRKIHEGKKTLPSNNMVWIISVNRPKVLFY